MQLNILRDFTEEMADQIRIYHYVEELVFSYRQFMTSHLKEEDIPLQECPLFIRLRFYDNKTQRELANEFHFTEGYTAKVLRNFEERNLISRVENPENRRQKIVSLTDDGKEVAPTSHPNTVEILNYSNYLDDLKKQTEPDDGLSL